MEQNESFETAYQDTIGSTQTMKVAKRKFRKKISKKKQKAFLKDLFMMGVGAVYLCTCVFLLACNLKLGKFEIDYTDQCLEPSGIACRNLSLENPRNTCSCKILFFLNHDLKSTVYAYYHLTNFYQNHRRYVSSYDAKQLAGQFIDVDRLNENCQNSLVDNNFYYAPCGKIANSIFNDTFKLFMHKDGSMRPMPLIKTDIAWVTEYHTLYKNPENFNYRKKNNTKGSALVPPNWSVPADQLDLQNADNNGYLNEAFRVWMKISTWSSFSKIYGKLGENLMKGNYVLVIDYYHPVTSAKARKKFVLLNVSILGEKNMFMPVFGCDWNIANNFYTIFKIYTSAQSQKKSFLKIMR